MNVSLLDRVYAGGGEGEGEGGKQVSDYSFICCRRREKIEEGRELICKPS